MAKKDDAGTDALTLLKEQHEEALSLLRTMVESSERAVQKRTTALEKVSAALVQHMILEEEIFYPAFEAATETADDEVRAIEAVAEHESLKHALKRLLQCDPATTEFRAIAKVVTDLVEHHASVEEEGQMFPRAKKLLGKEALVELGARMEERVASMKAAGAVDPAEWIDGSLDAATTESARERAGGGARTEGARKLRGAGRDGGLETDIQLDEDEEDARSAPRGGTEIDPDARMRPRDAHEPRPR